MNEKELLVVQPESESAPITTVIVARKIEMYLVSPEELKSIVSGNTSIHLTFFGLTLGAAITLLITLFSVAIEGKIFGAFVGSVILTLILSGYFGIRAWKDWGSGRETIKQLMEKKL